MRKLILLIFLFPFQVISQDLPVGFVNFLIPKTNKNNYDLSFHYDLYTDSTCSDKSYYGYFKYDFFNNPLYYYPYLNLHLKDSLSVPDSIIPSIGYVDFFTTTTTSNPKTVDTIYKADEDSFFTVIKLGSNKVCFALNDKINLWVKINETMKYYNPSDFLTNVYPFAYSDPEIKLYSIPNTDSLIKIKTKLICFRITEVENNWAYVTTETKGQCEDDSNIGVKEAWIIWYDKKLLIRPFY